VTVYDDDDAVPRVVRKLTRDAAARMIAANGGDPRMAYQGAERTTRGADALRSLTGTEARSAPAEDYLTAYERARSARDAEAEYHAAYMQRKADAELYGLYIGGVRHSRGAS